MVTYFGKSTVCTIAVYVTLVPRVRQLEKLTVDHVSFVYLNDHQFGNLIIVSALTIVFDSSVIGLTNGTM